MAYSRDQVTFFIVKEGTISVKHSYTTSPNPDRLMEMDLEASANEPTKK